MQAITHGSTIYSTLTVTEAKIQVSAYKALNEKFHNSRFMTPSIKDTIITALVLLEDHISALEAGISELPQSEYDKITDEEAMKIF